MTNGTLKRAIQAILDGNALELYEIEQAETEELELVANLWLFFEKLHPEEYARFNAKDRP